MHPTHILNITALLVVIRYGFPHTSWADLGNMVGLSGQKVKAGFEKGDLSVNAFYTLMRKLIEERSQPLGLLTNSVTSRLLHAHNSEQCLVVQAKRFEDWLAANCQIETYHAQSHSTGVYLSFGSACDLYDLYLLSKDCKI